MSDARLVAFLQRALPRLRLRWSGFRRVRGQVGKRLAGRLRELGLSDLRAYEVFLDEHPEEWEFLDRLCRITISRFYRDRGVWDHLRAELLPGLAAAATDGVVRCWSAGCASGEEPYTLSLAWWHDLRPARPRSRLEVVASDRDAELLDRAREAVYPASSLRDLPPSWRESSFERLGDRFRLLAGPRRPVSLVRQDVREQGPDGRFDVILCRNLAFTYFEPALQAEVAERFLAHLGPRGVLVIGSRERLPGEVTELARTRSGMPVFRRS